MLASPGLRRWRLRLLILGSALLLLGAGLVALDGYIVHVACELDRIVYELGERYRGRDPCIAGELTSDKGRVVSFAFLPVGTQIVLGTRYGLELWDATGQELASLGPPVSRFIGGIAVSLDGKRIVSLHGFPEQTCVVWDLCQGTYRRFPLNQGDYGYHVAISPDGRMMAVSSYKSIELYDVFKTAKVSTIVSPRGYGPADCPIFSADGKFLLFVEGREVFIKELQDGGMLEQIGSEDHFISEVALSPDGKRVAVAGEGFLSLWNLKERRRLYMAELRPAVEVSRPPVSVSDVAFSPDARLVAVCVEYMVRTSLQFYARRRSLLLFDASSGKQLSECKSSPHASVGRVGFSADGRLLAVVNRGKVRLLDVEAMVHRRKNAAEP